jgi:PAS domain S-box-containing protein
MTAGLFLGLLLLLGFLLWVLVRQHRDNVLQSSIIAKMNCSVLVTDATFSHHPIIYANPTCLSLTGYTEGEMIGQTTSMLAGADTDRASMEKLAMALQDGCECRVQLSHYRKNGTSFWNDVSLTSVKDRQGRVTSVVWTMREVSPLRQVADAPKGESYEDVAARRQVEQVLRDTEARLDLAVETGQVGFFEHDHRTNSVSWSPILCDIYGLPPGEPASWQCFLEFIHPDDRDQVSAAIQRAHPATGNGRSAIECRLVRRDGAMRHISLHTRTWFDGDGASRRIRTLVTVIDVTDRKGVEVRRREIARTEAIGIFAGGIGHELNNDLTAVLGFSELALPLIPVEGKAHRHITQVIAAAKKSRELIRQLLAFGGQNDQGRCPLFLHSLAKESLRFLHPTIPLWIELRTQIAEITNPVSANAVQMHEMIFNLLDIALRSMQKSGGVLYVRLENREFVADQILPQGRLPAGSYVCLSVRDTGEGMDLDRVHHSVSSLLTSKFISERQGVGLAVAYGIVKAHGGILTIESQIAVGTTVSVYLPVLQRCAPSSYQKEDPLPHGDECILFVDDEDAVVRFGREVLESLGYYPVICRTAAEALEVFQVEPKRFDLLITDRTMSGMSGDRLARECRRLRPDLPIILCSGSNGVPALDNACSQGIFECLAKPLTLHELAQAIRRALDRSPAYADSTGVLANSGSEPSRISIEVSDAVGPRGR